METIKSTSPNPYHLTILKKMEEYPKPLKRLINDRKELREGYFKDIDMIGINQLIKNCTMEILIKNQWIERVEYIDQNVHLELSDAEYKITELGKSFI